MPNEFGDIADDEKKVVNEFGDVAVEAAPAPVEEVVEAVAEEPGFLERSKDRIQLGLSDAMTSVHGDTYDDLGSPTEVDDLPVPNRLVRAAREVLEPGMDIAVDAISSVTPDSVKYAGGQALEGFMESPYGKAAAWAGGKALPLALKGKDFVEGEIGETNMALLEDATVLGAELAGAGRTPGQDVLKKSAKAARKADIRAETAKRMMPDKEDIKYKGKMREQPGLSQRSEFVPNEGWNQNIDAVNDLPDYDPSRSYAYNEEIVEKAINEARFDLDANLDVYANDIPVNQVKASVDAAKARAAKTPTLTGDGGAVAEKIYAQFDELMDGVDLSGGDITATQLLNVRRDLDGWLRANSDSVFDPGKVSATKVATRAIRDSLNELVDAAAPDAAVRESLARQSKLLDAREMFFERALPTNERTTRLGRAAQRFEQATGISHPTTPLALSATAGHPLTMGLMTAGAGYYFGKDMAKRAIRSAAGEGTEAMAQILRLGTTGSVIDSLQEEQNRNRYP
jgi:hypothetical protein